MATYAIRRAIQLLALLVIVSLLTFVLMRGLLGDPVLLILGPDASVDQATVQRLRHDLLLDEPLPVQYLDWLRHASVGDFGRSLRSPITVHDALLGRLPVTLELSVEALALALLLAVPMGIQAALRPGSRLDVALAGLTVTTLSLPNFLLGILLIFVFAIRLHWLPSAGYVPLTQDPVAHLRFMVLPVITLAAAYTGNFARFARSLMLDVLSEDYVRTARAKGLPNWIVLRRHAARNALIPLVTVVGVELAGLFGGAVITETVFSLPGVGQLLTDSVLGKDLPTVQAIVLFLTVAVVVTSFVVDLVYGVLDPRARIAYG
ncbi:MAG TPA: ABC transporter permease [Chloroflexota bacterium]|nr:ABC transporter permease [Chloroflexota bacterium]